ncbi:ATP-binding protein [Streptomyces himalayensis]|uniref:ATP-binding protein n=2 Tax=Streptomyces himalayensis TaxID=2820085 RepID=A0A7W2CW94_9ACTN|nr:ATP-binding protein [Streptomyces himalayensis]MBA2948477.1 ATP-binding protein [Streptomyces himalayensis subsp. himalayensis]MBA4860262.1 ATP-binding protein [Streptomyces himalayensis subsp. aureolus]
MKTDIKTLDFYRLHLPTVGEHSLRHVRRIVRAHLHHWELPELSDAAELGVTELLSNVLRHVPDRACTVTLRCLGTDAVRIEVHDRSRDMPYIRVTGDLLDEDGRGLVLLAAVADLWDAERTATGKQVWFELKRP